MNQGKIHLCRRLADKKVVSSGDMPDLVPQKLEF
jgi:hypothetical protein